LPNDGRDGAARYHPTVPRPSRNTRAASSPKEQLIAHAWAGTFVGDDVLTRAVSQLRRAFHDDPRHPQVIETNPKGGYRLIAPVIVDAPTAGPPNTRPACSSSSGQRRVVQRPPRSGRPSRPSPVRRRSPSRVHYPRRRRGEHGVRPAAVIGGFLRGPDTYDLLHDEPRFEAVLRQVGLPQ
jgi:hypothetical protein